MTLTAGAISLVQQFPDHLQLSWTAASGGTGPYTQQLYMSTTSGFSPGGGNLVAGATGLSYDVTGLIPGTQYYFKVVYTDTGNSNVTVTSAQFGQSTAAPSLNQNQFAQLPLLGTIDQTFPYNTKSMGIDTTQPLPGLKFGAAVKMVDGADGAPKVVGCTADSDEVMGFINFDIKTLTYVPGSSAQVSQDGNVVYLYATTPVARGAKVSLDVTTNGGVRASSSGSSGDCIVGWAYDKATAAGQLIRVQLKCPYFGNV